MEFIKDKDCTIDTPVIFGKEKVPIYGKDMLCIVKGRALQSYAF